MSSAIDISKYAFSDESRTVRQLLERTDHLAGMNDAILAHALPWTRHMRTERSGAGIEDFLKTYSLNTAEGIALMSLAEALLRIPDNHMADRLIQSTLEGHSWARYTKEDAPWLVHLSGWGLLLTGKVLDFSHAPEGGWVNLLRGMTARLGDPIIREALKKAMRLIGRQFVLGETINDALSHAKPYESQGNHFSYDMLGEGARSDTQAQTYVKSYRHCIAEIAKTLKPNTPLWEAPGISVKLSALHARYALSQQDRVMSELLPRLVTILQDAKNAGIAVAIDAEESSRLDIEIALFEALLAEPSLANWNGIGFVAQAYQKRALPLLEHIAALARKNRRVIPVRLVKGAYWDSEIKWAQVSGLPSYPVYTRKEHTDVSYLACADYMLAQRDAFYPQFATHNARTAASVLELARHHGWKKGSYEFQRLHGMGEALHDLLLKEAPSRIYAPVGPHKDLLAYLIRRLLENGANSSFVHLLMDESKSEADILADPRTLVTKQQAAPNPSIPLPSDLYGAARKNSMGMDFGNLAQVNELCQNLPAPSSKTVPLVDAKAVDTALTQASQAFTGWSKTQVEIRAAILERAASLMEQHRNELVALLSDEGGKTLADGIAEVREAADYCRYYAAEAKRLMATPETLTGPTGEYNRMALFPRGIIACISPWNFPLAIFTGQIAAALASGNCAVAKPARQTPRIAQRAIEILHEAGVPKDALHLLHGSASVIGDALTSDPRIAGIVFTGSVDTARHIQTSLSKRSGAIVPFIAETGGQNAMIVDSSALLEQAIDDIVLSAFGSAGQRCSALRVLCVQEDIADELLTLLKGAMHELRLGDPRNPATDIGPVIDANAQAELFKHIELMKQQAKLIGHAPEIKMKGAFVAPHAFEIGSIAQLTGEVFGPVLHVVRFKGNELASVCDAINATGFGLTFGIHSRISENIEDVTSRIKAGNIYVNRSMIGATVGVQPFGGENLSGTGPKAGGPHYLLRFVTERTISVNSAAIGGNMSLLAGI